MTSLSCFFTLPDRLPGKKKGCSALAAQISRFPVNRPHCVVVGPWESETNLMTVKVPPPETLGDFIRRIRTGKGLSLAEVERRSGRSGRRIAASYINRIENGYNSRPTADRMMALAEGLGVPLDELFAVASGRFPAKQSEADEARLLSKFRELPEDRRADVLRIIESFYQEYAPARRKKRKTGAA